MIMISNNVKGKMELPDDAVIRVNVAWMENEKALFDALSELTDKKVYLDFPMGRTKPPIPRVSFDYAIFVLSQFSNISYFGISNAEIPKDLVQVRNMVPKHIKLIPKIETPQGVIDVVKIVKAADTDTIMLDKEDLYTAVKQDTLLYNHFMDILRKDCLEKGIIVLELQGVIFYAR